MAFTNQWMVGPPQEPIEERGELLFRKTNRYNMEPWSFTVTWAIYGTGLVLVHITLLLRRKDYTSVVLHWCPHEPPMDWVERQSYVQFMQGMLGQEEGPDGPI